MQEIFSSNPVYSTMAVVGTLLFLIKILLLVFAGDFDIDSDLTEIDGGFEMDGGTTFSLISVQSVLAFFMGTGWTGLAALHEWNMESFSALVTAVLVGIVFMTISSFLTLKMKGLNSQTKFNIHDAIEKTGRAYTTIPAKGDGVGQVELTVGGKQQILQAMSVDEEIKSFDAVKVISVDDSGSLHVTKV